MPIYEYCCSHCETRFELLRPMSQGDQPAACPHCAQPDARRMLSRFAAIGKDSGGGSRTLAGSGGGCGSCAGKSCAGCGSH